MNRNKTRLENVRKLINECGGAAAFADKLGMSGSQVSQFAGRNPIRNIGNNLAEKIEAAFGKRTGWLDGFQKQDGPELMEIYDSLDDQFKKILLEQARSLRKITNN